MERVWIGGRGSKVAETVVISLRIFPGGFIIVGIATVVFWHSVWGSYQNREFGEGRTE